METQENKPVKEICTLTIAFPVVSDDAAIEIKKKVGALLVDMPDVIIDFRIRALPTNGPSLR